MWSYNNKPGAIGLARLVVFEQEAAWINQGQGGAPWVGIGSTQSNPLRVL
jgi:hypothetical protein